MNCPLGEFEVTVVELTPEEILGPNYNHTREVVLRA